MIIFILGSGGSGKTTIAQRLLEFGFLLPKIFTTRQYRSGDVNQIYLTEEEYQKIEDKLITSVQINGFKYGLNDIVENCVLPMDIYTLKQLENKGFDIIKIYLDVPENELKRRMIDRGDDIDIIQKKLKNHKEYRDIELSYSDLVINNKKSIDDVVGEILEYIERRENYDL